MRKSFLFPIAIIFLVACGNDSSKTVATKGNDITKDPNYQKGLQLEVANDCKTCHAIDVKITGPAFREIADKYAGYPDTIVAHLASKVISGGMGVWGEIPMLAHANLEKKDAESIVRYILLLKTNK